MLRTDTDDDSCSSAPHEHHLLCVHRIEECLCVTCSTVLKGNSAMWQKSLDTNYNGDSVRWHIPWKCII